MDMEGGFAFESTERLFVYRHKVGVAKTEGAWRGRARHVYDPYSHVMRVTLYPTRLADNGEYREERWASQQSLQSVIYQYSRCRIL